MPHAKAFRRPPIYEPLPLTENQLDAVVATAEHLLALDLPPLFRLPTIRALWRRAVVTVGWRVS